MDITENQPQASNKEAPLSSPTTHDSSVELHELKLLRKLEKMGGMVQEEEVAYQVEKHFPEIADFVRILTALRSQGLVECFWRISKEGRLLLAGEEIDPPAEAGKQTEGQAEDPPAADPQR